jgi:pimeloyl-ACP methyl ester carboxylesterase
MKRTLTALATILFTSAAQADTFVLVHGAFQTADRWAPVAAKLQEKGHTALTVNLPGRSGDGRALGEVTMDDYIAAVSSAINGVDGKVVLVGHSFGGMTISGVAEAMPERIATLVYVAAYLPKSGDSMQSLAATDHHNGFKQDSFVVAADYSHASLLPRDRIAIFAADAPADMAQAIADAMVDEPLQPIATPVTLTPERFGTVRAAYVATLADMAVSTPLQLTMIGRGNVDEVIPLPTGHSPHSVAPDDLVTALIAASTPELE